MLVTFKPAKKPHKLSIKENLFVYGFQDITHEIYEHPAIPIEVFVYLEDLKTKTPNLKINFFLIGENKEKVLIMLSTESELAKVLAAFNLVAIRRLFLNNDDCKIVFKCISSGEIIE